MRGLGAANRPADRESGGTPPRLARLFDSSAALPEHRAAQRNGLAGHGHRWTETPPALITVRYTPSGVTLHSRPTSKSGARLTGASPLAIPSPSTCAPASVTPPALLNGPALRSVRTASPTSSTRIVPQVKSRSCGRSTKGFPGCRWPCSMISGDSSPDVSSASAPSVAVSPNETFAVSWNSLVGGAVEATFVSISRDQGNRFSAPIEVSRYRGMYELELGGTLVFDGRSRLYVAWQSFGNASEPFTESSIYVGSSGDLGQNFTNASFSISLQGGGANGSSYQHLAAGPDDHVYLTWYDVFGGGGALFRSVSGEASGDVATQASNARVDVELLDPISATLEARATWTGSRLVFVELPAKVYDVWVRVGNASALAGAIPVRTWKSTAFTVRLGGGPS